MSVGGRIIDMKPERFLAGPYPGKMTDVVRFWVVDRNGDETCVHGEPAAVMPKLGDEIWWQSGKIMFDGDRQTLKKVGASFSPPRADRGAEQ